MNKSKTPKYINSLREMAWRKKIWNQVCRVTRCTTWESWVRFYWGQNEDCSPGDSTSDSSERLLQGGSGGRSVCTILVKGEFSASQALTLQKVFCQSLGAGAPMKRFSALLDMKRCKDWDHEISFWKRF